MRCSICDYSKSTVSIYYDGLNHGAPHYEHGYRRKRIIPAKNGIDFYCEDCYHEILNHKVALNADAEDDRFVLAQTSEI